MNKEAITESIKWIEQELNDLADIMIDTELSKDAKKQYENYYHSLELSRAKLIKIQSERG